MTDTRSTDQHTVVLAQGDRLSLLSREGDPDMPVVMIWTAMGVAARKYTRLLDEFAKRGVGTVVADYRGFGASTPRTERGTDVGYHDIATIDFPAVVAEIENVFPGRPIVLLGHSLGGQIGLMYAAARPVELAGIVLIATNTPYYRVYPGTSALAPLLGTSFAAITASLFGYYPGDTLNFLGRQPKPLILDWARLARTNSFDSIGHGTRYSELMRTVDLPVLAASVDGDWMAPPAALDALCAHIPNAELTRKHFDKSMTGGRALGHIAWINHSEQIAEQIADWVRSTIVTPRNR
ncbi:alpha/beta hydrolase family protein [Rhodococcoides kyotonense]|uniref:Predicted alpha/beta hydrolase n=1 Tax=Rhodococcoides kyotonense TaxID=398843 RepID=A0A239K8U0_9NOCA|nr:alpha/beta fold hydrolase [Rhodococcus kyotonensis]SNT14525.1 Predicted alpha/beta hydrolase [Rhodococcus kyotonensis]